MNKKNRFYTDFLFSTSSFLSGAGTAINLAGNYYEFSGSESSAEADERAIRSDFCMIGQDINDIRERFEKVEEKILCK